MSGEGGAAVPDAVLAARLCALDPRLGGLLMRGSDDRARDAALAELAATGSVTRLPIDARDDQLDGGIDLTAALAGHGAVRRPGLLERGGLVVVPLAERLSARAAARIGAAIDRGGLIVAALVDGIEEGHLPDVLADRLAFHVDLDAANIEAPAHGDTRPVTVDTAAEVLATAAVALGIGTIRAALLALRAAQSAAWVEGRRDLTEADLALAARLVLGPRATRLPASPDTQPSEPAESPGSGEETGGGEVRELAERVLAAAAATVDPDLLAALATGRARRSAAIGAGGGGERRRSRERGRPVGTRAGDPRRGDRLALVETLRAAAPWQAVRGRSDRLIVRRDDLRVHRREARAELVAIFAVDASGSAAAARLAEVKGAVELLLGQAYVQRAQVALVAFRGAGADLLLPPTRSVTRARRALADLPGGGGTPLASGLAVARAVALGARARGRTPVVVVLSDGRANVAADGRPGGRAAAEDDALTVARLLRGENVSSLFVDTGARARPEGARIAAAMDARYLPLPYAGAAGLGAAVSAFARQLA